MFLQTPEKLPAPHLSALEPGGEVVLKLWEWVVDLLLAWGPLTNSHTACHRPWCPGKLGKIRELLSLLTW